MVFKRKRSRRGGKRKRHVVRKLTASSINRALTSVRSFRGQQIGQIVTTSANSEYPVIMSPIIVTLRNALGVVTPQAYPRNFETGWHLFSNGHLQAIAAETGNATAVPATMVNDPTYATETNSSANPLKYHGHWCKMQVRNCSLNPVRLDIYDLILSEDQYGGLGAYNGSIYNYLNQLLYQTYSDRMNNTDLQAMIKDLGEANFLPGSAAGHGLLLTNDYISPAIKKQLSEWVNLVKHHEVVLAPGQSYMWSAKGFKPYTYYPRNDSINLYVKNQSYVPMIRARGELGLSSTGIPGYSAVNLAFKMDYGIKCYKVNALQHQFMGNDVLQAPPSATAILGPSEDVQAA